MANHSRINRSLAHQSPVEAIRRTTAAGNEFWSSRDFARVLGDSDDRNFEQVVQKARMACFNSAHRVEDHFVDVTEMVDIGSGAQRSSKTVFLSRYGCYLVIQNADPGKEIVALGQTYFAIQTRRQELSDQQVADLERLELRRQASEEFKMLSGAARQAGVQSQHFGIFHDAGYKGLYGGLGSEAIRQRKRIPAQDNLMDRMDATELAANQFRMTQTREKLARDEIRGEQRAIQTHNDVGKEVRAAIQRIGGTLPENIPPAEHIKQVEQRVVSTPPKLVLADSDACGLSQLPGESDGKNAGPPKPPT